VTDGDAGTVELVEISGRGRPRTDVVILGAGGHGRQLRDIIEAENDRAAAPRHVLGFLDDGKVDEELLARNGDRLLGSTALLPDIEAEVAIGIADPAVRRRFGGAVLAAGRSLAAAIHPLATFGSLVEWGPGAMISAGSYVDTNVRLGRLCHVNVHVSIGHDSCLGDHVTVLPGARISGAVTIGDDVVISSNAVVFPGVSVGDRTVVAAGSIVHHDLPADTTYLGLRSRRVR